MIDERFLAGLNDRNVARLRSISERDWDILAQRIGVGVPRSTLREIGGRVGLSKERVRQIEFRSRKMLEISKIDPDALNVAEWIALRDFAGGGAT